jgi:pimeloyl-ACP methyl ester carboxylesterase
MSGRTLQATSKERTPLCETQTIGRERLRKSRDEKSGQFKKQPKEKKSKNSTNVLKGHDGRGQSPLRRYQGVSETDLTEDLKSFDVPTLVMRGDDDQIVPYKGAARHQVKLLKNATLKLYPGFPHGMLTTYSDTINPDLLAFIKT